MKYLNLQQSWPTLPRVENRRWQPTNRKYSNISETIIIIIIIIHLYSAVESEDTEALGGAKQMSLESVSGFTQSSIDR